MDLNKWKQSEIDQLKTMVKQGLYYKEIGAVLNRSKAAISGKVNRLGISPNRPAVLPRSLKMALPPKPLTVKDVCNTSYRQGGAVPMIALDKGMCKWPMFDRDGFCGHICGDKYCDEHLKVSRRKK